MLLWALLLPISLALTVICYLTNWFVLFFCDENGELHGFWRNWQTWDNSCNPSDIKDTAPSFIQFGWDKHYKEFEGDTFELREYGRKRWFTTCIDDNFSLLDRLKRYLCRLSWLTRNNCYGWAFYILGKTVGPANTLETIENSKDILYVKEKDFNLFSGAWLYKTTAPIFTIFGYTVCWNNFLGWKLDKDAEFDKRAMIANRIAFHFIKN